MPIIPPTPISGQIGPSGQKPYGNQFSYGSLKGAIMQWNPNLTDGACSVIANSIVRKVYDRRLWYGLMVKGQLVTPPYYSVGTVQVTTGSATVTGIGTTWTPALIGRSLRVGYNNPIYNIVAVASPTSMTIELPWGNVSYSSVGYFITQYYFSIPNIKYIYAALNLQMQFRMWTNMNQNTLDNIDPSRMQLMYPYVIAGMPPDTNGNYQVELWPASMIQQAIPYIAYIQPPNLVNDEDNLPPFIRGDIIVAHGIADALRYRPKDNPWYDPASALAISQQKMAEFEGELIRMEQADENQYRQDIITFAEQWPYYDPSPYSGGSTRAAMSPVGGYGGGGDGW